MTRYRYDKITRLTQACPAIPCGTSAKDFTYAYDQRGNITSKSAGGTTTAYDYTDANELTCAYVGTSCATSDSKTTYTYDPVGNLDTASGLTTKYNTRNQMIEVTPAGAAMVTMDYADYTSDRRIKAGDLSMAYSQSGLMSQGPSSGVVPRCCSCATPRARSCRCATSARRSPTPRRSGSTSSTGSAL